MIQIDLKNLKEGTIIKWIDKSGWENPESNSLFPYSKSKKAKWRKGIFLELWNSPHRSYPDGITMIRVKYRGKKKRFNPKYYIFKIA